MNTTTSSLAELLSICRSQKSDISELPFVTRSVLHSVLDAPPECDNAPVTRSVAGFLVSKSPAYLAVMASKGDYSLPFYRSGRSVFYTLKSIKDYLKHTTQEPIAA